MATRLIQTCETCEPCSQGCCCEGMFTGAITAIGPCVPADGDDPNDGVPPNCRHIEGICIYWNAPNACLERLADAHGGLKQYEFYLNGCPEGVGIPDRIASVPEIEAQTDCGGGIGFSRVELMGSEVGAEECTLDLATFSFCVVIRGQDDEELTRCYVCISGADIPDDCIEDSSSSSDSSPSPSSSSSSSSPSPPSSSSSATPPSSSSSPGDPPPPDPPPSSSSSSGANGAHCASYDQPTLFTTSCDSGTAVVTITWPAANEICPPGSNLSVSFAGLLVIGAPGDPPSDWEVTCSPGTPIPVEITMSCGDNDLCTFNSSVTP